MQEVGDRQYSRLLCRAAFLLPRPLTTFPRNPLLRGALPDSICYASARTPAGAGKRFPGNRFFASFISSAAFSEEGANLIHLATFSCFRVAPVISSLWEAEAQEGG